MDIPKFSYFRSNNKISSKINAIRNKWHNYQIRSFFKKNPVQLDYSKIPMDSTPILLNNFNRLEPIRDMLPWILNLEGKNSVIIVDNDSSYPPLLEYYKTLSHPRVQIIHLGINSGTEGMTTIAGILAKKFKNILISDSDLMTYPSTPNDIISHLKKLLDDFPTFNHIGMSLEIEDLPDHFPLKEKVYKWESQFWKDDKLIKGIGYKAAIDTTFAMYRNTSDFKDFFSSIRTQRPYTLKHVDWYINPEHLSKEYIYYLKTCKNRATWAKEFLENEVVKLEVSK